MFEYQSIEKPIEDISLKEKGSKFIGFAYPVISEEEVKSCLNHLREIHPKATHHCYAYRLGLSGENYRANDDGEPSGSAGLPIYNQLLAHQLTNILVVVIRYYGGTKLGVSGLVKTYKESAKLTLESANIITKELESELKLSFKFSQQNVIFSLLNKNGAQILDFDAQQICHITARVKTAQKENISNQLSEMLLEYAFIDL
ncbi:YigZ family protein [Chryseobacterium sp. POL2]|uniref:IMPACT family protein n=1 Tax=Chryseobacterium sp. POL2 TaxID=2713414 RepID=UPI0013E1153F|nr:YigZ family protein [Chryseobacterium sp. POL2]QIG90625.1 YigZ family protein [Chryseobacterium sp. POL2]